MRSSQPGSPSNARLLLLPLVAFCAILPLILHGCSCGHDFDFHLQNWLDAAQQFRHGNLHPHWISSAAWNAGEPRFLFYPPLSWTLGAVLSLVVPFTAMPALFTWIALTAAAFSMYRLARRFASANAALLAATLYIVNPYILFTAYERTAYAELLAAAFLPLLLDAALAPALSIPAIAASVALLWLTNAPAAVMGCYTFAAIIAIRLVRIFRKSDATNTPRTLIVPATLGTLLGLALAAFYLLPAAYERRYVQIAMAIIPNMRFQDNFLFGHTADGPHNQVLHTASLIAVTLLIITAALLALLFLVNKRSVISSEAQRSGETRRSLLLPLTILTLLIAFLLTPISTPLWNHLPELSFLQFPWRLLAILGVLFALAAALLLTRTRLATAPYLANVAIALLVAIVCSQVAHHLYAQGCSLYDGPVARAYLFSTQHGVDPTDEYTPNDADNDVIRTDEPAWWLGDSPAAFAPGTTPNLAATIVNYDVPPAVEHTISGQPEHHFTIYADKPEFLILNLRDYPNWRVNISSSREIQPELPTHIARDDGLIALPIHLGDNTIDITWHRTWDQTLGAILSALALATFLFALRR